MNRVALITLGCAKNLVDSEVMLGYLAEKGYAFVSQPEEADIIIINTCGFIHPARNEALDALQAAVGLKKKDRNKKIFASGCYVERNYEELKEYFPDVDGWFGVKDFDKIVQVVEGSPYSEAQSSFLYDHRSPRLLSTPAGWAYVKISEGCSHGCSFCAIPQIKGAYRSRPISSIVREVENLTSNGVKEIDLISQDTTYYGRDFGKKEGLPLLLEKLLEIRSLSWIRLLYGYPEEVSDRLLEVMQEERVCSYLDIPFQHADSGIIKIMKRGLDGKRALHLIEKIRKKLPDTALRTSLIVGFPGEAQKEFEILEHFVRQAQFDHLGVFTYSKEANTDCYPLGDPVGQEEKERRKEKLMGIQSEISFKINGRYLNRQLDVLIEGHLEQDKTVLFGRGKFQAPEVDGVVFIDTEGKDSRRINAIHKVEITDRDIYDLYGVFPE
jgi:ribosomal protein S12 methylthiotransferase